MAKRARKQANTRSSARRNPEPHALVERPGPHRRAALYCVTGRAHIVRMTKAAGSMGVWERRALTTGEVALGRSVFGDEIAWSRVRILQAPKTLGFGAMVPLGRTIVFSRWRAARDFADASLDDQGWFVHELMHVWQAANSIFLAGAKLRAIGKRAYVYKPRAGAKLSAYNIERQAEIARHLFIARCGACVADMPSRDWLEAIWETRPIRGRAV